MGSLSFAGRMSWQRRLPRKTSFYRLGLRPREHVSANRIGTRTTVADKLKFFTGSLEYDFQQN